MEIYALAGIGKTTFALSLAIAAALGHIFPSLAYQKPWRVLYIDGEMTTAEMIGRDRKPQRNILTKIQKKLRTSSSLSYLNGGWSTRYWRSKAQETYNDDIDWADLIFLDNLSCLLWSGRENDADSWSVMQQWMSASEGSWKIYCDAAPFWKQVRILKGHKPEA